MRLEVHKEMGLKCDVDNTAVDSMWLHNSIFGGFLDAFGIDMGEVDLHNQTPSIALERWVDRFPDGAERSDAAQTAAVCERAYFREGMKLYQERVHQLEVFEDFSAFLEKMRSKLGIRSDRPLPVALVTNSVRAWLDILDERFHFSSMVQVMLAHEDFGECPKPHPFPAHLAAQKLGFPHAGHLSAAGDALGDIECAVEAGCRDAFLIDRTQRTPSQEIASLRGKTKTRVHVVRSFTDIAIT